jgi:Flp pilus assembly protein TadD
MKIILVTIGLLTLLAAPAFGAGSPSMTPSVDKEIQYYNKGVDLMMNKKFSKAEKQFRKALDRKERFAEAHNNLAYVLRKQGPEHYEEALSHYNRAIAINPRLSQPYMYRGVLYMQMGDTDAARKDLATLTGMDPGLAKELAYVIENGREKEPEQFFGVSPRKG